MDQILADIPELSIVQETSIKVDPFRLKPKLSFRTIEDMTISIGIGESQTTEEKMQQLCKPSSYESMLLG